MLSSSTTLLFEQMIHAMIKALIVLWWWHGLQHYWQQQEKQHWRIWWHKLHKGSHQPSMLSFVWLISGFVFALLHLHAKQSMRCLYSSRMSKTGWYLKEHMCQCCAVGRYQPWLHGGKVTNICQSQKLRTLWRLIQTSSNQLCLLGLVICLKKTGKL